ncbi:hypothetical protein CcI49_14345 [Frankia sp. CcI49]|uniref:hypothetical protein n=1 Tax=unclassified Frankia TaxID=2632575 RepID=UPI0009762074|nr:MULTISPECIES: hypothetical protein [unclassified Frankia]ONH59897.1 hypothetical protein CcI49_14345 [Frankia sp. CcI49]
MTAPSSIHAAAAMIVLVAAVDGFGTGMNIREVLGTQAWPCAGAVACGTGRVGVALYSHSCES